MLGRFDIGLPTLSPARLLATVGLIQGLLAGCQAPAVRTYEHTAAGHGFSGLEVAGDPFNHRVYLNRAASAPIASRLHVYIDGDGIAWHDHGRPALEPTARNPLVLRLMALDPGPAIYLGRPCYLGVYDPAICAPWYWTHGRYGKPVVDSMVRALTRILEDHAVRDLTLIGYSGGGTLAMLMAARLAEVSSVVTLAANLDVQAWADHHGYSPLSGSLDPARQPPLPAHIRQWHWVGGDDLEVPPGVLEKGLAHQPGAHAQVIPGVDHACCWEDRWPLLLKAVTREGQATRQDSPGRVTHGGL